MRGRSSRSGQPVDRRPFARVVLALAALSFASVLPAAVSDITPTDVTTRAFSVVWASDEPVTTATLRVFADSAGLTELTGSVSLTLASQAVAESHTLGVVKVDVRSLAANTCYYFQTETTTASGTVSSPAAAPFTEVCTQIGTERVNPTDEPIVNDLILHDVFAPDGGTPGTGAIMLLSAPTLATHPISAIVGEEFAAPSAMVDLNNLFDLSSKISVEVPEAEILQISEFRGLLCPNLTGHQLTRYRRAPAHGEIPTIGFPITELEVPDTCFFADTFCDDTIDIMDAQRVLTAFTAQPGDCRFNSDLDIVADQIINVLDVQSVLNRFGESAPFSP